MTTYIYCMNIDMLFDDMDFESKKSQLINMIESIEQKQSYMIENNIRNPVLWKDFEDRKVLLKINFMKIRKNIYILRRNCVSLEIKVDYVVLLKKILFYVMINKTICKQV